MPNEQLSAEWLSREHAQRVELLKRLLTVDITLTADRLGIEVPELDKVAAEAGLVPVRVTVVDAAGMREWEPGVAGPAFAAKYPKRKFEISAA